MLVEQEVQAALNDLERRCRSLTGLTLAMVAFVATYGILLVEGQTERPVFHFFPWLTGGLFYLAGDLLAMIWFNLVVAHLRTLLKQQETRLKQEADARRLGYMEEEAEETVEV
jgi:hypothetical protein